MFPTYNSEDPTLLPSMVCFTDILGFSNLITDAKDEEKNVLLKNIHSRLQEEYALMRETNEYAQMKTFTDNVILAYPLFMDGEGEAGNLFITLITYQLNMTLNGYFLRGGIDLGDYYGDKDFAYGSSLIEAHRLEAYCAKYPRIILSDTMLKLIYLHTEGFYSGIEYAPQMNYLLRDSDGIVFLNYLARLNPGFDYEDVFPDDVDRFIASLKKHKAIVENNLLKHKGEREEDKKVYAKYAWVADYHDYYCKQHIDSGQLMKHDLLINHMSGTKHLFFPVDSTFLLDKFKGLVEEK